MKFTIEYISTFYDDILSVVDYLEEYPQKAARVFDKMEHSLKNLVKMPKMYPIYRYIPAFRYIVIEDYLVFYKVIDQKGIIEIHRLINARMDVISQIKEL